MNKKLLVWPLIAAIAMCFTSFAACDLFQDGQIHKLTKCLAVSPTCEEDGHCEYWICSDCGKYFSDESASKEIFPEETVIPATGHEWNNPKTIKKPTCTEEGTESYECLAAAKRSKRRYPQQDITTPCPKRRPPPAKRTAQGSSNA